MTGHPRAVAHRSLNASPAEFAAAGEPRGPPDVPLWQILRRQRTDPLERWNGLREQFGEVARYRYGLTDTYFLTSAEGARRVLQENAANYTKQHPAYGMLRRLFGNGLFTSEGSFWLRQRRLAQPAFHRQRIAAMGAQMTAAAEAALPAWEAKAAAGEPVSMLREMAALTLRVVGDALFGTALAARAQPVAASWEVLNAQLVERYSSLRLVPPILPTRYDRDFRRARRTLFAVVDEIIADKRAHGGESDDLLSLLMHVRDEDTGEQMDDAQLRDEVVTLLLAGHETTAIALAWTWTLLAQHPDAAARLHDELHRVLAGRAPTAADYERLPFARAVIDEALRLRSPVYILFRRACADDVVCGQRVRKGATIVLSPLLLHRHPAYWDAPGEFRPERWADAAAAERRPRFAFLPFSGGPRQCIGNGFAMLEAVLLLATLAQRFEARLAPGYTPAPEYLVLARPSQGAPMTLHRR